MATVRNFELMQYIQYLDIENMKYVLDNTNAIVNYAWIIHDKDKKADGNPKDPHIHCYVKLDSPREIEQVAKWFKVEPQYINKCKSRFVKCLEYLTHKNDSNKYQYSVDEVNSNYNWQNEITSVSDAERKEEIARQINDLVITRYNYYDYISIEEYSKWKTYIDSAFKYVDDRMRKEVNRNMEVIFIQGASGCGKTTYAKKIAKDKNLEPFVSDSGEDPLSTYMGQPCIILDDLRGSSMRFADLLKMLDNHTSSAFKSRYYNKIVTSVKLIIITTVHDIDTFFKSVFEHDEEPIIQLKRRCKLYLRMDKDNMSVSVYDDINRDYVFVNTVSNPVKEFIVSAIMTDADRNKYVFDMLGIDIPSVDVGRDVANEFVQMELEDCPFIKESNS